MLNKGITKTVPIILYAGFTLIFFLVHGRMVAQELQESNAPECMIFGLISYDNPAQTGLNNLTVSLVYDDSIYQTTQTDFCGQFIFSDLEPLGYEMLIENPIAWGGANALDAHTILRHFVGMSTLSGLSLKAADPSNDQVVNAMDALLVAKRFVMLIDSFPAGDWIYDVPPINFDEGILIFIEIKGLCVGDVNASYLPEE